MSYRTHRFDAHLDRLIEESLDLRVKISLERDEYDPNRHRLQALAEELKELQDRIEKRQRASTSLPGRVPSGPPYTQADAVTWGDEGKLCAAEVRNRSKANLSV